MLPSNARRVPRPKRGHPGGVHNRGAPAAPRPTARASSARPTGNSGGRCATVPGVMLKLAQGGVLCCVFVLSTHAMSAPDGAPVPLPDAATLNKLSARFAPVDLTVDVAALPESERAALVELIAASKIMDALFLRQVWAGNDALLLELMRDRSPLGQARLRAFLQNKGPWLRLDGERPFIAGVGPKPPSANFYPAGATKAEVEGWMHALPPPARAAAEGFFTTIRRAPDGKLQAVPYSLEYQGELERAADAAARRRPADNAADAARFPRSTRRRLPVQRLLRQRRRLDEARRQHRTDHRPLRDVRGRLVQRQGGVRGVRQPARRRGDREAGQAGGRAAGDREQPADRRQAAQPEARRDGPDPRRQPALLRRRRQQGACRRPPSTSRTTNASSRRSAASAR